MVALSDDQVAAIFQYYCETRYSGIYITAKMVMLEMTTASVIDYEIFLFYQVWRNQCPSNSLITDDLNKRVSFFCVFWKLFYGLLLLCHE